MKIDNVTAILLNGPALCGKGILVDYLRDTGLGFELKTCKDSLHKLTMNFFNVEEDTYWGIYNDRSRKESPSVHFALTLTPSDAILLSKVLRCDVTPTYVHLSIREAMIFVSEVIYKPRFGEDYFGEVRAKSIQSNSLILDDSSAAFVTKEGSVESYELKPLIRSIGKDNILLLRVHRTSCNFNGDSRRYIPDGIVPNTVDIFNNGDIQSYLAQASDVIHNFLKLRKKG